MPTWSASPRRRSTRNLDSRRRRIPMRDDRMTTANSRVTIHMVASLDGFIARRDGRVDWLETSDEFADGDTLEQGFVESFLKTALRVLVWVAFGGQPPLSPAFRGEIGLPSPRRTCHDAPMAKLKRLLDIYRFPGFVPRAHLRGIFGDPLAVVITLQRRRKKRPAASVGTPTAATTTSGHAASATWPVATNASISTSRSAGSGAPGAVA